ncbi:MAG: HAD-IIB family hydrolase [Alphaproteobacteria bacterium]|jgi:hypothetical protein|nr:HAD-IIB family hydrolase [Alphaproteobacteria bacterium]
MRPLAEFSVQDRRGVRAVLFDIDDTLTTDGKLTAEAYGAMADLQAAGLLLAPITGRPAGWCDHIARMWPVDGVVGENGAFYFRHDADKRRMIRHYAQDEKTRAAYRRRLDELCRQILTEVPGSAVASDQFSRQADLAIDFREDVPPLPMAAAERIVALFQAAGARAKTSSIHVNGWFGGHDKLSMARQFLLRETSLDPDADNGAIVFVGDSPNDAPMFGFFQNAVGVANLSSFKGQLDAEPCYLANASSGAGFAELARALLSAR